MVSNHKLAFLGAVMVLFTAQLAHAQRTPVPIQNFQNQTWMWPGGKALTTEEVKERIIAAVQEHKIEDKFPWRLDGQQEGMFAASAVVRDKHTVRVNISYTATNFGVIYAGSDNMKAGKDEDGKEVIHPFYNRWAEDLARAIREQLGK